MRAPLLAAVISLLPAAALAQGAAQAPPAPAAPPAAPAQAARPVLGLDEAVRTALAHQPQLRQAQANREAAEARAESARAPLLPQLRGSAGVDWATHNTPSTPSPSYTAARTVNASAVATQVLFDAAQLQRWRSSLASASALEASERAAALQIAASTRAAFFAARAARDLVAVARESLANEDAHLKQVQAFVQVGTRPEIDLAQARAARANAQVQVIQAENAYDTARAQLVQATGVVRATDFDIGDDVLPAVPGEDQPLDPLFAEALASRPEIVSFSEQERAQTLARSAARAGYLPTVGAEADVSRGLASTLPDGASNWGASVTLTWNLFQGGATRAAVREAEANLTALSAQDEQFRQQIRLDVEQARLAVRASRGARGSAGAAETAARERLRLAEGRYRAGAGSIIELGDAQVAASSAAAQRVQSEFNLAASRAQLLRALGRLNP
jgi:outer membrane protein